MSDQPGDMPEVVYAKSMRRRIPKEHRPGFNQGTAKTKRRNRERNEARAADRELEGLGLKKRVSGGKAVG